MEGTASPGCTTPLRGPSFDVEGRPSSTTSRGTWAGSASLAGGAAAAVGGASGLLAASSVARPSSAGVGVSRGPMSGARTQAPAAAGARANYEGALLQAMRRQMEDFQDKVSRQVSKLEVDRHGQVALARLEEKLSNAEAVGPRFDRRMAELGGNFKGLSEEMQAQIRRVDQVDEKVWHAYQQMKEDVRSRFADAEQQLQKVASAVRISESSLGEGVKRVSQRLLRLEAEMENRSAVQEDTRGSFQAVCARLDALEDSRLTEAAANLASAPMSAGGSRGGSAAGLGGGMALDADEYGNAAQIALLQQRIEDMCLQTDRAFQDAHEVYTRLAAHEMQLGTLRTLCDSRDEQLKRLSERVERGGDWESKLEALRQAVHEESTRSISQQERVELLLRRAEHQETQVDELRGAHERLSQWQRSSAAASGIGCGGEEEGAEASVGNRGVVEEVEDRIATLAEDLRQMRTEMTFGPQVSSLLVQLQDIVPKVVDHDRRIREFAEICEQQPQGIVSERVAALESQVRDLSDSLSLVKEQHQRQQRSDQEPVQQSGLDEQKFLEFQESISKDIAGLRGFVEETKESLRACRGDVASLQGEVQQVKTSSNVRGSPEPVQATLKEFAQKQNELEALVSHEVEDIKSSVVAMSRDHNNQLDQKLEGATDLLREGLASIRAQCEVAVQTAQGTVADLTPLRTELSARVGALRDLEGAVNSIADLKGLTGALDELESLRSSVSELQSWKLALADLGGIKANISELKSPKDSSALTVDLENVRSDLASLWRSQGSSAELLEALRGDVNRLKSLGDVDNRLASLRDEIAAEISLKSEMVEFARRAGAYSELASIKSEIAGLRSEEGTNSELANLSNKMAEISLKSEMVEFARRAGAYSELASIKSDIAELRSAEELDSELASMKGDIEQLKSRGGVDSELASIRCEIAELKERGGIDGELASFKSDIAELKQRGGADMELASIKSKISELAGIKIEIAEIKSRAVAHDDLACLKSQLDELRNRRGADQELSSLRSDIAELKSREGAGEELTSIKSDIVELKSRQGGARELEDFKGEIIAELGRRDCSASAETLIATSNARLEEDLRKEISELSCRFGEQEDMARLRSEVTAMYAQLEAMALTAVGASGENGAHFKQLTDLALAAQRDEAEEEGAHRRLLLRIDDLCARLAEVDTVVTSLGGDAGAAVTRASESPGGDPEFRRKLENLVSQVDAMGVVERQIQAKFDGFVSNFTQQSAVS